MYYQGYRPPPEPAPQPHGGKRRPRRGAKMLLAVVMVLLAAIAALVISSVIRQNALQREVESVQGVYLDNVYVDGIHLGGMTPQQAIDAVLANVNARQNSWSLQLTYRGHVFTTLNYAMLGAQTDIAAVYKQLETAFQLGHTGSLRDKKDDIDSLRLKPYSVFTTQSDISGEKLDEILSVIGQNISYPATDAHLVYFDPNADDPFIIQQESTGMALDVAAAKATVLEMAASGSSGALEMTPETLYPTVTEADVRKTVALRGKGVTPVSKQSTAARTDNIRLALSNYNGLTLEAGESVSFNTLVGERSYSRGYQYAIEYANGMEEWNTGGGVCQASTTVYLAALTSGMQITKRTPHADAVSYTTFGQDATVYYSRDRKIDFAFKNNADGKIYITAKVEQIGKNNYQCVVCIYGPSLGDGVSYKLRTITVETIPAPLTVTTIKDTNQQYVIYKDEEYEARKARGGYINETYLQRWENGVMTEETLVSRDTCKAREAVIYVGTQNR